MKAFANHTSLKQNYYTSVRDELIKRFVSEDWFGLGCLIQQWTRRCDDHMAADVLKPMLERAEEQFQLARNGEPFQFEG